MPDSPAIPLITQTDTLLRTIENWSQAPFLAVDTEFVRVDTYYARLCLIQVQAGETTALIDTTAFDDLSPLLDVLYAPDQIKVFHAPGQDLEILSHLRKACPQPLFDTQIAATLLGFGDQLGYAGLIERRLGITLDKSLSRTDWARRPLRPAELAYAAADVIHLAEIYPALQDALAERGRLAWLAEDCARLCDPDQYVTRPDDAWQRLKGIARLNAREQTVAAALATWREAEAQQRNRPRKWIVDDDVIYILAQRRPQTLAQLEALNALPPKSLARHGEALIELIAHASALPERLYQREDEPDATQKALLKHLQGAVQQVAAELEVPASFLAPRADLMRLVRLGTEADAGVLSGWRREVCGTQLLASL
ncbi:ribonuclease D [Sinimarinibacterium sp. CAU 1509]|uniref:ribonuclease D n=1 Tax=Sinimarinibacterium sp. CAU 1509 TaxID=2562283 RepID=UPI0010AC2639|nr:ribonuclease D [Sinimarinibacterium sp. CAU 1509]TJY65121.1 ribonuclease D [Sinimarinibacterium sp. CAU 1509]